MTQIILSLCGVVKRVCMSKSNINGKIGKTKTKLLIQKRESMKKTFKIILAVILITVLTAVCTSALSKIGSRSDEVREIQTRLKKWGYYNGSVDGIFGTETKKAVVSFQKANGLTPDGIAGKKTLAALGINSNNNSY